MSKPMKKYIALNVISKKKKKKTLKYHVFKKTLVFLSFVTGAVVITIQYLKKKHLLRN